MFNPKITASLQRKSRANRVFFDHLVLLIWCEIRLPKEKRDPEWYDVELPSYRGSMHNNSDEHISINNKMQIAFDTPKQILSQREIAELTAWMNATFVTTFREGHAAIAAIVGDCIACGLNVIEERHK